LFRRAPTFDPLQGWRGRPQRHLNAFGKTGSGKSTNIRALLAREAEQGTQIIILDPQPHARRLGNLFDFNTVGHCRVGYGRLTFNPLDVVWDRLDQQSDYARAIFKIMLNPDGDVPRRFNPLEVAAIDAALKATYEGYDWSELLADQSRTPTLELFCKRLQSCGQAGRRLAFYNATALLRLGAPAAIPLSREELTGLPFVRIVTDSADLTDTVIVTRSEGHRLPQLCSGEMPPPST
jgi:hypothetical protein